MMQRYTLNAGRPERQIVLNNVHALLDRLPPEKSWRIEIKPARRERTDPQNHALFGVAYPALDAATGYTKDELHEAFCRRFFGSIEKHVMGEVITRPYRTTTTNEHGEREVISAADFARFYELVQTVGAEIGIDVPDPDPLWHEHRSAA